VAICDAQTAVTDVRYLVRRQYPLKSLKGGRPGMTDGADRARRPKESGVRRSRHERHCVGVFKHLDCAATAGPMNIPEHTHSRHTLGNSPPPQINPVLSMRLKRLEAVLKADN